MLKSLKILSSCLKVFFRIQNIRILNLSLHELKLITRNRLIKGNKSMSKERLLNALNESESAQSERNLNNAKIKQIREDLIN